MLKRSIVLIMCICMVGATVLPASAIACCCKSPRMKGALPSSQQAAGIPAGCCSKMQPQAKSCCDATSAKSCCSGKVIKAQCNVCRCLDLLQIVGLTGCGVGDSLMRTSCLAVAAVTPEFVCPSQVANTLEGSSNSLGFLISLRTCTLRC